MLQMFGFRRRPFWKADNDREEDEEDDEEEEEEEQEEEEEEEEGASENHATALRLVYSDENGKFHIDPQAVSALHLLKGPLGVISVCGRARQGKSFILNQLLGRSSGFQVSSTHRPCTKGLWMWSIPLKRVADDGTEYSLLLLDTEGIDAYDQTGTYSVQIFSLAVLLSSMFVYNQMGGIDEAALDRLSLVTEIAKHIRVKASENQPSNAELGQYSPFFLWLLRDFYLELCDGDRRMTPGDYLESALQHVAGHGKAVAAKNEIRDSIRALFPDRDCFTLVRPLNEERDLQQLDKIPLEKMRVEFQNGLEVLSRFILERTKPKQMGSTVMTGPLLAGLTQSFLDALNAGAVPTICTSWQNVEEQECQHAHVTASTAYAKLLDKPSVGHVDKVQELYEMALHGALDLYDKEAVGLGGARHKYRKLLITDLRKKFDDFKHKMVIEAELACVNALQVVDQKLHAMLQSPSATLDDLFQAFHELLSQYKQTMHGPTKWKVLVTYMQRSFEGPILDFVVKSNKQMSVDNADLRLKCESLEDRLVLLGKQLNTSQKEGQDWKTRFEMLGSEYESLEGKSSSLSYQLEGSKKEAADWQSKYDNLLSVRKADEDHILKENATSKLRCISTEVTFDAAKEEAQRGLTYEKLYNDEICNDDIHEKNHHEEINRIKQKKLQELEEKCRKAEREVKHASEVADRACESAAKVEKEKLELERVSAERLASIQRLKEHIEELAKEKGMTSCHSDKLRSCEQEVVVKPSLYEMSLEGRQMEINEHFISVHEQKPSTLEVLKTLLDKERQACAKANSRAEALSVELTSMERKLVMLEKELTSVKLNERVIEAKLKDVLWENAMTNLPNNKRYRGDLDQERALHDYTNKAQYPDGKLFTHLDQTQKAYPDKVCPGRTHKSYPDHNQLNPDHIRTAFADVNEMNPYHTHETCLNHTRMNPDQTHKAFPHHTQMSRDQMCKADPDEELFTVHDHTHKIHRDELQEHLKYTIAKLKQELTAAGYVQELLQLRNPSKKDILDLYEKLILKK